MNDRAQSGMVEEEIRLSDLMRIFAARVPLMAVMLALSLVAALVFLWWAQPIYRAQLFLLQPLAGDVTLRDVDGVSVSSLNIERLAFEDFEPEKVYDEFRVNLQSRSLRREFFDREKVFDDYARVLDSAVWSPDEVFEDRFNRDLQVHQASVSEDERFVRVSLELDDPVRAAELLNGFVEHTNRYTVRQLVEPFRLLVGGQVKVLKDEIALRRETSLTLISDQIEVVDEAAKVAKSLGLVDAVEPVRRDPQGSGISVNTADTPIYRRGEKALRAELAALEERKGNDAFVSGLRDLEEQLARVSAIELDLERMRAAQIDQAAVAPDRRVFPRTALVLALAVMVGVILAIGAALAHYAWQRIRREIG